MGLVTGRGGAPCHGRRGVVFNERQVIGQEDIAAVSENVLRHMGQAVENPEHQTLVVDM